MSRKTPAPRRTTQPQIEFTRRRVTASGAITSQDALIEVDSSGGAVVQTLPPASSVPPGAAFVVVWVAGTAAVSVDPNGNDTVNGGAAGVAFVFGENSVRAAEFVSDGLTGWQVTDTAVLRNRTITVSITAGTLTATSANLGLGSLAAARLVCGFQGAAPDATLTRVSALGNVDGTITVTGNANATAPVTVAVFADAR